MKTRILSRLLPVLVLITAAALCFSQQAPDPWPKSALMEPAALAAVLQSPSGSAPTIFSVAFPVLYRAKHISSSVFAGPGSKPEGIDALKKEVAALPKNSDIVIYCGCCPMDRCPNLRPAFQALREMGFSRVRVLSIPTNMHTDWYTKNYPSEAGPAGAAESPK